MKRETIIFMVIFITAVNSILYGDSNALAENNSTEALYKKIIGGLMQENADLKANLSKLKNFNAQLEKKAKTFYLKARDAEQMRNDYAGFNKLLEKLNKENTALKKENDILVRRLENSQKEKAILNQELGAVYTKAKLFPQAIETYLRSLTLNPDNAGPHYNLGLLYQHSEENTKKSLYHFKKYLELNPNAKNKKEVEYLIAVLTE